MSYKPVDDYGLVGDMHSAAVVGRDGSIDWLCFPRFDSPSAFAAILDDERGGCWRICPTGRYSSERRYLPDTNILCTTFSTDDGAAEIQDLMPLRRDATRSDHEVLRVVHGVRGTVEMECLFRPRLDYARGRTALRPVPGGVVAQNSEALLALASPVRLAVANDEAWGAFAVRDGDEIAFLARWGVGSPPRRSGWRRKLSFTADRWRGVAKSIAYEGRWRDEVRRSVLALHLLLYMPTGAIVAAATTSLPEEIGGGRNWDYRFCWIRDAAFVMDALDRLGHIGETTRFLTWLAGFCKSCGTHLRPLYGIRYEEQLGEAELGHLEGYRASKPVRIGNAASSQLQMDIFGEFMIACATYHRAGGKVDDVMWMTIESFVGAVIDNWRRPDRGIWEVRGRQRHFVHSKIMCWLTLDRAIQLADSLGRPADLLRWREVRDEVRAEVLTRGWSDRLDSFVQYYGAEHTDAALLMIPMVGFLPADDPRMRSTVRRIRAELEEDGLLRRYLPQRTDDGLQGGEGIFTMCTLWLAGYLASVGDIDEACALFERVLTCGNDLGLFSEMFDPVTGEALGNFPQAFTHVSLIHTARNLDLALNRQAPPPATEVLVGAPDQI